MKGCCTWEFGTRIDEIISGNLLEKRHDLWNHSAPRRKHEIHDAVHMYDDHSDEMSRNFTQAQESRVQFEVFSMSLVGE